MGLDMYLKVRKNKYSSEFRGDMEPYPAEVEAIVAGSNAMSRCISINTDYEVGYWRKANAIHQWFVDNCAEGVDDCREMYVSRDKIEELRTICLQVLVDPEQAEQLLPTADGFFFGSTEYDEYYLQDVKYTAELLQRILKLLDAHEEYSVIYEASW